MLDLLFVGTRRRSVERHGFTLNSLRLIHDLNGGVLLLELFLHLVLGETLQLLRRE
jgi:hypothetical protein